jgi:hypothetical protein
MSLSLTLVTAALLAADPSAQQLPPGHPPLDGGVQRARPLPAPAEQGGGMSTPSGPLPPGHPPTTGSARAAPGADELLEQLDKTPGLRERDKTFEVAASLARLYYSNGRPRDALHFLDQARAKSASSWVGATSSTPS